MRITDMSSGRINWDKTPFCSTDGDDVSRFLLAEGDLLLARVGYPGISCLVENPKPSIFASYLIRARPYDPSSSKYLAHFFQSQGYWEQVHEFARGIAQQNVNATQLSSVLVPVPPQREQQRIVAALDERLSELDASVASLERAERNLIRYRAAVLAAACSGKLVPTEAALHGARTSGPLEKAGGPEVRAPGYEPADQLLARILAERRKANTKAKYEEPAQPDFSTLSKLPEGWAWATVEQVAHPNRALTYGVILLGEHVEDGVPVLRSSNVRPLWLELDNVKRCAKQITDQFSRTYLQGGELLVTVRGTLGGVVVVPESLKGANVSREVAVIPPMLSAVMPYLALCLASPQGKRRLAKEVKGNTYQGVNIEDLRCMPFGLPPLAEQERIVAEVDRHLSRADALAASIAQSKRRAQRLRRAILAAAFQGRLVPQDPNDEPASVLLDRIRAQAATAEAATAAAPRRGRPPAPARAAEAAATYDAPAPKRRGRPPGSKNKAKA